MHVLYLQDCLVSCVWKYCRYSHTRKDGREEDLWYMYVCTYVRMMYVHIHTYIPWPLTTTLPSIQFLHIWWKIMLLKCLNFVIQFFSIYINRLCPNVVHTYICRCMVYALLDVFVSSSIDFVIYSVRPLYNPNSGNKTGEVMVRRRRLRVKGNRRLAVTENDRLMPVKSKRFATTTRSHTYRW